MVDSCSDDLRRAIEKAMSNEDEDMMRGTVIGSTAQWLADDPSGDRRNTQVPAWGEHLAIKFVLEPILKRATFKNETEAREGTPWHLMRHVLNMLARMELVRQKAAEEAKKAYDLNASLKKAKGKATGEDDILPLPSDARNTLRSLASPKLSTVLREHYLLITHEIRRMHIYESLRNRTAGVDDLIKAYFPQKPSKDSPDLYISIMKDDDEINKYTGTRTLTFKLYKDTDVWEDDLLRRGMTEDMMNGDSPGPDGFSYPVEFEARFSPSMEWRKLVDITLNWSKSVLKMVKTLDDIFNHPIESS